MPSFIDYLRQYLPDFLKGVQEGQQIENQAREIVTSLAKGFRLGQQLEDQARHLVVSELEQTPAGSIVGSARAGKQLGESILPGVGGPAGAAVGAALGALGWTGENVARPLAETAYGGARELGANPTIDLFHPGSIPVSAAELGVGLLYGLIRGGLGGEKKAEYEKAYKSAPFLTKLLAETALDPLTWLTSPVGAVGRVAGKAGRLRQALTTSQHIIDAAAAAPVAVPLSVGRAGLNALRSLGGALLAQSPRAQLTDWSQRLWDAYRALAAEGYTLRDLFRLARLGDRLAVAPKVEFQVVNENPLEKILAENPSYRIRHVASSRPLDATEAEKIVASTPPLSLGDLVDADNPELTRKELLETEKALSFRRMETPLFEGEGERGGNPRSHQRDIWDWWRFFELQRTHAQPGESLPHIFTLENINNTGGGGKEQKLFSWLTPSERRSIIIEFDPSSPPDLTAGITDTYPLAPFAAGAPSEGQLIRSGMPPRVAEEASPPAKARHLNLPSVASEVRIYAPSTVPGVYRIYFPPSISEAKRRAVLQAFRAPENLARLLETTFIRLSAPPANSAGIERVIREHWANYKSSPAYRRFASFSTSELQRRYDDLRTIYKQQVGEDWRPVYPVPAARLLPPTTLEEARRYAGRDVRFGVSNQRNRPILYHFIGLAGKPKTPAFLTTAEGSDLPVSPDEIGNAVSALLTPEQLDFIKPTVRILPPNSEVPDMLAEWRPESNELRFYARPVVSARSGPRYFIGKRIIEANMPWVSEALQRDMPDEWKRYRRDGTLGAEALRRLIFEGVLPHELAHAVTETLRIPEGETQNWVDYFWRQSLDALLRGDQITHSLWAEFGSAPRFSEAERDAQIGHYLSMQPAKEAEVYVGQGPQGPKALDDLRKLLGLSGARNIDVHPTIGGWPGPTAYETEPTGLLRFRTQRLDYAIAAAYAWMKHNNRSATLIVVRGGKDPGRIIDFGELLSPDEINAIQSELQSAGLGATWETVGDKTRLLLYATPGENLVEWVDKVDGFINHLRTFGFAPQNIETTQTTNRLLWSQGSAFEKYERKYERLFEEARKLRETGTPQAGAGGVAERDTGTTASLGGGGAAEPSALRGLESGGAGRTLPPDVDRPAEGLAAESVLEEADRLAAGLPARRLRLAEQHRQFLSEALPDLRAASQEVSRDRQVVEQIIERVFERTGVPLSGTLDEIVPRLRRLSPRDFPTVERIAKKYRGVGNLLADNENELSRLAVYRAIRNKAASLGVTQTSEGFADLARILGGSLKELWLMTPRFHLANALDAVVKSSLHRVPLQLPRTIAERAKVWGTGPDGMPLIPERVRSGFAQAMLDATGDLDQTALEQIHPGLRAAIGGLLGAAGGPAGAAIGAGVGLALPGLARLNRALAESIEATARGSAWFAGKQRFLQSVLPDFAETVSRAVPRKADAVRQALLASEGMLSPDDVARLVTKNGGSKASAEAAANEWRTILARGDEAGAQLADHINFNYTDTTNLDEALRKILPFHFWATRNIPFYAEHLAENPALLIALLRYDNLSTSERKEAGIDRLTRFAGMIPVEGQLGDALASLLLGRGGSVWANPAVALSIAGQLRQPFIGEEAGPLKQAYETLTSFVSPWPHLDLAAQLALEAAGQSEPESPQRLIPQSRFIRALTGVDIEQPIRAAVEGVRDAVTGRTLRSLTGDPSLDYNIRKKIAELAVRETGQPPSGEYLAAMYNPQSPIYQRALAEIQREELGRSAFGLISPIPVQPLSKEEAQIRAVRKEYPPPPEGASPDERKAASEAYRTAVERNPVGTAYSGVADSPEKLRLRAALAIYSNLGNRAEREAGEKVRQLRESGFDETEAVKRLSDAEQKAYRSLQSKRRSFLDDPANRPLKEYFNWISAQKSLDPNADTSLDAYLTAQNQPTSSFEGAPIGAPTPPPPGIATTDDIIAAVREALDRLSKDRTGYAYINPRNRIGVEYLQWKRANPNGTVEQFAHLYVRLQKSKENK
jgi:hypothetical protein